MKVPNIQYNFHRFLIFCFPVVLLLFLSFPSPNYSFSSTNSTGLDALSLQNSIDLDNMTTGAGANNSNNSNSDGLANTTTANNSNSSVINLDIMSNSTGNATISLTPGGSNVNLELPPSIVELLGSTPPLADQMNITENLTNTNDTAILTTNETQLAGNENVTVFTNFTSKPLGLETDYAISGKPFITINDIPLNYEYLYDPADEITISDILISMRASIKLDNSTNALPVQLRVFTNPTNVTENADGSRTFVNDPTTLENIEIGGVIFSEVKTAATVYPNGTGTLNATNVF
ncbi:hypothetical protein [Candidatus Nitrosocosmicus franklandus]|uniref:Uncharacterized protein n=1 Tax=Candidatus Nitrosocosmicus franklandianus TaxID=1798806 RepID=A0A484I5R8_9ARCH|nr:hypothetical protein [Candidatus Nitrosocosmicus franklandus]VFJ12538.1 conserved exported protein of unknown function [Candidatus Nitrosocosmicus franklandus]